MCANHLRGVSPVKKQVAFSTSLEGAEKAQDESCAAAVGAYSP